MGEFGALVHAGREPFVEHSQGAIMSVPGGQGRI